MTQNASQLSIFKVASNLLATTATAASILFSVILPSQAAYPDGYDPIASGCNDARTLATAFSGSNSVELRISNKCRSNWVKANVPRSTTIYLKGEQGQVYMPYKTQVNGSSYGNMMNWNPPYKACARLSNNQEFCTILVR